MRCILFFLIVFNFGENFYCNILLYLGGRKISGWLVGCVAREELTLRVLY